MLGMKKKARGIELIEEVAGRFSTMIEELEKGVEDCEFERSGIQTQIQILNQRGTELYNSVTQAQKLASNLRNLIG